MIQESIRVLKAGGVFRCCTPDLDWIIQSTLSDDWKKLRAVYERIGDFPAGFLSNSAQVVNWAFHGHGHQHLWNWNEFRKHFENFGFHSYQRKNFGESDLPGAAIEKRKNEDFYSIIVEAIK